MTVTIGVSLKTYFSHARATEWMTEVARRAGDRAGIASGAVTLFVVPTYPQLPAAVAAFEGTPVVVGAQDISAHPAGAFTGEVTAAELAEIGVGLAEIGHAERRRLFGETDEVVAEKTAAALAHGVTPLLCVGETASGDADAAARCSLAQVRSALAAAPDGPVIVAYEPVWAIGAPAPAPTAHIQVVCGALRDALAADPRRAGSRVIYGGSAGPGLLTQLSGSVDGLFLGRFAHDVDDLLGILDEASAFAGV